MTRVILVKLNNFGAVGDGSDKGNVGKVGKISNFGAVDDGSDKGNLGKIGKVGKIRYCRRRQ